MRYVSYIVGIVLGLALVAVGIFLFSSGSFDGAPDTLWDLPNSLSGDVSLSESANTAPVEPTPPEGYVEYRNERYGFRLFHPPQVAIKEYDEGEGAMTIVFEDKEVARGFQIFVVPYAGTTVTEERFKADVPSGVRTNVAEINLGTSGIKGVAFDSVDEFLGETRETWFIHNGRLFEVTTVRGFSDWLAPLLETWRFL